MPRVSCEKCLKFINDNREMYKRGNKAFVLRFEELRQLQKLFNQSVSSSEVFPFNIKKYYHIIFVFPVFMHDYIIIICNNNRKLDEKGCCPL